MSDSEKSYRLLLDDARERMGWWLEDPATAPSNCYVWARDVIQGPWPEAEWVIALDGAAAARYAIVLLRHPWPEAEAVIRRDAPKEDSCRNYLSRFYGIPRDKQLPPGFQI